MTRMLARRRGQIISAAGSDQVFFGLSLPSDTVINSIRAQVHLVGTTIIDHLLAHYYAIEGWILPVLDPDAATQFETIWDNLVPKDTDVEVVDLDVVASDTSPFFEPGEVDWTQLLDVGLRPKKIYGKYQLQTYANAASKLTVATDDPSYVPTDVVHISINKRMRVTQPSILAFAFAVPSGDDTSTVSETALAEGQWGQVKYIDHVMERGMLHLFGVVEAGAETPWEEATALLKLHLEPDVREETAGHYSAPAYNVDVDAIIDHSVVGSLGKGTITTGR